MKFNAGQVLRWLASELIPERQGMEFQWWLKWKVCRLQLHTVTIKKIMQRDCSNLRFVPASASVWV